MPMPVLEIAQCYVKTYRIFMPFVAGQIVSHPVVYER